MEKNNRRRPKFPLMRYVANVWRVKVGKWQTYIFGNSVWPSRNVTIDSYDDHKHPRSITILRTETDESVHGFEIMDKYTTRRPKFSMIWYVANIWRGFRKVANLEFVNTVRPSRMDTVTNHCGHKHARLSYCERVKKPWLYKPYALRKSVYCFEFMEKYTSRRPKFSLIRYIVRVLRG